MTERTPEQHRLDDATRELGLQMVHRLRAAITAPSAARLTTPQPGSVAGEPPAAEASGIEQFTDPAVIAALMAAGAERDRLEADNRALRDENAALRAGLAAVLQAAATAIDQSAAPKQ